MIAPPLLATLLGLAGPDPSRVEPPVETLGYETAVTTRTFEVLDLDLEAGIVLFRHVFTLDADPDEGAPAGVDCGYPGLAPGEAEVVGLYDVRRDTYAELFMLHPPARAPDRCATADETARVQAALDEAKAARGLDDARRPDGIPASARGDAFVVHVDGKPVMLTATARRARPDEIPPGSIEPGEQLALLEIKAGEQVLHLRRQAFKAEPGVGRELGVLALFVDGGRAVALERFTHRPPDGTARTLFRFSPVLDLAKAPPAATPPPSSTGAEEPPAATDESCNPFTSLVSCGVCGCLAPVVAGCGCAVCCDEVCGPSAWLDILNEILDEEKDPQESPPPPPEGDSVARF